MTRGHLLLAVSVLAGAVGHTLLKQTVSFLSGLSYLAIGRYILNLSVLSHLILAFFLLLLAFAAWLGALRYLDLSYAYAMASASVLVVAVLAALFLGESLTLKAWFGLLLIVIGCALIAPTQART